MDGISLDAHGRLSLTPLNMTLGIFSVATRTKPEAWTTIYFHPDPEWESTRHTRPATAKEKMQNLHTGLEAALKSFRDACNNDSGIKWDHLWYAGKQWKVELKFSIAYIIGDTELHDKLCGKYGSFNKGVVRMCRHCNCYSPNINIPSVQEYATKWTPEDFHSFPDASPEAKIKYFKNLSHHDIKNVFHGLCFGSNHHNIHFATPGECLHMHQLGTAKRAVESIELLLRGSVKCDYAPMLKTGLSVSNKIGHLAQKYGALLSRQSDRNFPRTKFGTQLLSTTKKEGHDFSGMLISIVVAISSKLGLEVIQDNNFIKKQIETTQLIISIEEFLKHGKMKRGALKNLKRTIVHFINCINSTCYRKGMGTKLIKNHLYFHMTDYIKLWGPPAGWDSAPSESHHKTEIKAPSKNTQCNASTLIHQTAKRKSEKMLISTATQYYNLKESEADPVQYYPEEAGSQFKVMKDEQGEPTMEWQRAKNKTKPFFSSVILDFVCNVVLPLVTNQSFIAGFTEHNRFDDGCNTRFLFRCHPCYRSDSSQLNSVWMDWCLMDVGQDESRSIPCQLLCFLHLKNLKQPYSNIGGYPVDTEGIYAVVRRFENVPRPTASDFVSRGRLINRLFLFHTDTIQSELAVVPEIGSDGSNDGSDWLVISNRAGWLDYFYKKNAAIPTLSSLYNACTLQDQIEEEPIDAADSDEEGGEE